MTPANALFARRVTPSIIRIPKWWLAHSGMGRRWHHKNSAVPRAIEPRYGYWTLPAGFMENNETTGEAASRETDEEAGADIQRHALFAILNVPHVHQVHLFYRATLLNLNYAAGTESLEVKLFTEQEIPWEDIAFPTVSETLRLFFADHARVKAGGSYQVHEHDITRPMRSSE
jgi:ADP-ribose pyrophosphatase YjhB (NUDIX family)